MRPKLWRFKWDVTTAAMIAVAIGINYAGKMYAELLRIPLWLDCIGTSLVSVCGGPVVGMIAGAATNIIYGLTATPISMIYAITSMAVAIVVGVMAHYGMFKSLKGSICVGLVAGIVCVLISTPLNIIFWDGMTGNWWGDLVFTNSVATGMPLCLASAVDEIIIDIPDKILVMMVVYRISKDFPESLYKVFQKGEVANETENAQ